jgi:hypothetical protein
MMLRGTRSIEVVKTDNRTPIDAATEITLALLDKLASYYLRENGHDMEKLTAAVCRTYATVYQTVANESDFADAAFVKS